MTSYLSSRISILVRELVVILGKPASVSSARHREAMKFLLEQMERMPWFLRFGINTMTMFFWLASPFYGALPFSGGGPAIAEQLNKWSRSRFRPCRDFVKFYAAMVVLSFDSAPAPTEAEDCR